MLTANKNRAFTLIELLLVIAIIGILVSTGLSLLQTRAKQTKVEKTALQIQQLLQAGMAYYVDNGCWPAAKGSVPNGCKVQSPPDFETTYVPVGSTKNPWGNDYTWTKSENGVLFQLTTKLADDQTANNIAALLPSAKVTGSTLLTEITIPAQTAAKIFIAAIGKITFSGGGKTESFVCPSGYKSQIHMSLIAYTPRRNLDYQNGGISVVSAGQSYTWPTQVTLYSNDGCENGCNGSATTYLIILGAKGRYNYATTTITLTPIAYTWYDDLSYISECTVAYTIYCKKT
jgi:prepilin-type N-terminal cleavage/methylation domain-containing protein